MVAPDDGAPEARPPRLSDLVALCPRLNEEGARYVIVGGMAIIQAGFVRATKDVDLLVEASAENITCLRHALLSPPDRAVEEMADADLDRDMVVRVADEIVVDLMKAACGIEYPEASRLADTVVIEGVPIPFASPAVANETDAPRQGSDGWRVSQIVAVARGPELKASRHLGRHLAGPPAESVTYRTRWRSRAPGIPDASSRDPRFQCSQRAGRARSSERGPG